MHLNSRHLIETNYECREYFISRIKSGLVKIKYKNIVIFIHIPTPLVEYEASELYFEKYQEAINDGMLTEDDALELLESLYLWNDEQQKQLEDILPKHIEYWKVELYNSKFQSNTQISVRKHLEVAKKELERLSSLRHSYNYTTCSGYAAFVKNQYIIQHSSYYRNGKPVDWKRVDLTTVMNLYYASILPQDYIRILARTNPWRDEWVSLKKNGRIFEPTKLSYEQKTLIIWSNMYDNILESSECPSEEVINDDDMLDGWLILQRRKNSGDNIDDKIKKIKGDEIYLVAETPQDARKINNLNNPIAQQTKKQRFAELRQRGVVKEQQFTDSKLKQSMQATQALKGRIGGKNG